MSAGGGEALGVGLLGASRIAPLALIAPARETGLARPVAVAARSLAKAQAFAAEHGVDEALEGYEALFRREEAQAVYNALPAARHRDLTLAALASGRHVLCEKPFALTAADARAMVAAAQARGLVLMEAFHYRYHPLFARLLERIFRGDVGAVRRVEGVFHAPIPQAEGELRYDPAMGGGALMDLGAYCVHWCRSVIGEEPAVVWSERLLASSGVDLASRAELAFPGGATARIACHLAAPFQATLKVEGERGVIRVRNPLVPQYGHALRVTTAAGEESETVPLVSTYVCQLRAFVAAVRDGAAIPTSGSDTIAQMEALDAIRAAARTVDAPAFAAVRA